MTKLCRCEGGQALLSAAEENGQPQSRTGEPVARQPRTGRPVRTLAGMARRLQSSPHRFITCNILPIFFFHNLKK